MTTFSILARFGTAQTAITLSGSVDTEATSVSEIYASFHLPTAAGPAKSSFEVTSPVKLRAEVIYGDGPQQIELKVTAGATAVGVTTMLGGEMQAPGVTGETILIPLVVE